MAPSGAVEVIVIASVSAPPSMRAAVGCLTFVYACTVRVGRCNGGWGRVVVLLLAART